jgi:hypothetical protein
MALDMTTEVQRSVSKPSELRGLVLLCGGNARQRQLARTEHTALFDGSEQVAVADVQALLRCATRSRAVIVCGELAGMSAHMVERLVRERAPQTKVIRADRPVPKARFARRRRPRGVLRGLMRPLGIPR